VFETRIFAKRWNREGFRAELRRIDPRDWIAIGTATDPYQPAERRFGITREMLRVFAEQQGRRLSLTTKSDRILRDLDLLTRIASANLLHVAVTVTTMDEALARQLEPYAPRPSLRMRAVEKLASAGLSVGVLACPILPRLNDGEASLDALARAASQARAACLAGGVVFLKPCTHGIIFPFLEESFPHLARKYEECFRRRAFLSGAYPKLIGERIGRARHRYGLRERFPSYTPEHWSEEPQMELPFGKRRTDFVEKSTCR
jgi:DNA repair photolyase